MTQTIHLAIDGMHCASCETLIGEELRETAGVSKVSVSAKEKVAKLLLDMEKASIEDVLAAVDRAGYKAKITNTLPIDQPISESIILKNQSSRKPMKIQFESHLTASGKILQDESGKAYFDGNIRNDKKAVVSAHKEDLGSEEKVGQLVNSFGMVEIFSAKSPTPKTNGHTNGISSLVIPTEAAGRVEGSSSTNSGLIDSSIPPSLEYTKIGGANKG